MSEQPKTQRLGLFLPLRLATYVILMVTVMAWMKDPQYLRFQVIAYSLATLGFAVSLSLERRLALSRISHLLGGLQFLLEISLESAVVYVTGNINSPFSAVFVLTIVSAALAYRMIGTILVASLVSAAYAFIIWLGLSGSDGEFSVQALRTIFSSNEAAFYGILLHILIFYLTAFMSGYLAERLSRHARQLEDASSALRKARLETDDILKHLNSGLLTVDAEGRIIYFNRAAEKILGYGEENVRGLHCRDVFSERMPRLARCLMMGVDSRVAFPRKELDIIDRDRQTVPLGLSTSILTENDSELRGVIAIFSDLTEAKLMEEKVRKSDRLAAVGELSASIAHEIRNPLAAISGSVELLDKELDLSCENRRLMGLITKESYRLNHILTDFLSYARLDRPSYNKVELCHIVTDIRELLLRHESVSPDIRLDIDSPESFAYVVGDEDLIRQLLMNLALNACEALDAGPGRVTFRVRRDEADARVTLEVSDDGPGMDAATAHRVYEPFFSTKKTGTGLGLAIVHRICNALSLRLQLHTEPGEGATFSISFRSYAQNRLGPEATTAESTASPVDSV
jgi:two-component system sensor histidine kinase PilS (NtrC family)